MKERKEEREVVEVREVWKARAPENFSIYLCRRVKESRSWSSGASYKKISLDKHKDKCLQYI